VRRRRPVARVGPRSGDDPHLPAVHALHGIGAGKTYPTVDDCQIQWQGTWDGKWPAADCEGKINQDGFDTCMAAIRGTSCTLGDLLNTLGKCDKMFVCAAGGADGG
jgi:hypothetical protein